MNGTLRSETSHTIIDPAGGSGPLYPSNYSSAASAIWRCRRCVVLDALPHLHHHSTGRHGLRLDHNRWVMGIIVRSQHVCDNGTVSTERIDHLHAETMRAPMQALPTHARTRVFHTKSLSGWHFIDQERKSLRRQMIDLSDKPIIR